MKFEITSTYFGGLKEGHLYYKKEIECIREVLLPYCVKDDDVLYIEIKHISELKAIQESLSKAYEDLDYVWSKIELIINFEDMSIEIYDYYRE